MRYHYRSIRLLNNAGMDFPLCYSRPKKSLLDTDKGRLLVTSNKDKVTCKHCLKAIAKESK